MLPSTRTQTVITGTVAVVCVLLVFASFGNPPPASAAVAVSPAVQNVLTGLATAGGAKVAEYFANNPDKAKDLLTWVMAKIQGQREIPSQTLQETPRDIYDIIIHVDSLLSLGDKGWRIELRTNATDISIRLAQETGVIGAVCCAYDVGKTFIINRVAGHNFMSGYGLKTRGVAVVLSNPSLGVDTPIYIDIEGTERSAPESMITDRLATDMFKRDLVVNMADLILFVVGTMRKTDWLDLNWLMRRVAEMPPRADGKRKEVVVVHNFANLETLNQTEVYIYDDILKAWKKSYRVKKNWDGVTYEYFESVHEEHTMTMRHVIFAYEFSEAGRYWNEQSTKLLRYWLNEFKGRRSLNVTQDVALYAEVTAPQYFFKKEPYCRLHEMKDSNSSHHAATRPSIFRWIADRVRPLFEPAKAVPNNGFGVVVANSTIRLQEPRQLRYFDTPLGSVPKGAFDPQVDVLHSPGEFLWVLNLPGVSTANITCRGKIMTVTGQREPAEEYTQLKKDVTVAGACAAKEEKKDHYEYTLSYQGGSPFGSFTKQFEIADDVKKHMIWTTNGNAKVTVNDRLAIINVPVVNGVLKIRGPREEQLKEAL